MVIGVARRVRVIPEEAEKAGTDVKFTGGKIPFPDTFLNGFHGQAEFFLAGPERGFRLLAGGDVGGDPGGEDDVPGLVPQGITPVVDPPDGAVGAGDAVLEIVGLPLGQIPSGRGHPGNVFGEDTACNQMRGLA